MLKAKIKELETLLAKLESPETELDDAFELYTKGQKLIQELQKQFEKTNDKLVKAKQNYDG